MSARATERREFQMLRWKAMAARQAADTLKIARKIRILRGHSIKEAKNRAVHAVTSTAPPQQKRTAIGCAREGERGGRER